MKCMKPITLLFNMPKYKSESKSQRFFMWSDMPKLLFNMPKYKSESKSQHNRPGANSYYGCCSICQSTNLKANHNLTTD